MRSAALEQRHRFVELALAPPQFAEADEPLARSWPGRDAASSSDADVSSRSASSHAPRHMHTEAYWVRHTANSGRSPHSLAEGLETIAPLHRALVVADALAGGNQVAAGEADHHAIAASRRRAPRR